jgi:hypothetical protein
VAGSWLVGRGEERSALSAGRKKKTQRGSAEGHRPTAARTSGSDTTREEERRVRYTLDLSREQHRFLKRFAFEAEVDASVVMRKLLALLATDDVLTRRVLSDLET